MKTAKQQQHSHHVSVPPDEGVRVDKAITIERPTPEVYSFWRQFENLPRFMRHLESVTVQDDLHSHWAVKTIGGKVVEWDAEIIEQRPNEMISWRSIPGADVDNAGSVWFTPVPGGQGTVVRIELRYIPPAGKTGALVAKLFRRDADSEIGADLNHLKTFLETGQLPEEAVAWPRKTVDATRRAANATNDYIHESPWLVIGSIAVVCFTAGFLLARSRK
jgi:uncharacterized membrane protein